MFDLYFAEYIILDIINQRPHTYGKLKSGTIHSIIGRIVGNWGKSTIELLSSLTYSAVVSKLKKLKTMGLIESDRSDWVLTERGHTVYNDLSSLASFYRENRENRENWEDRGDRGNHRKRREVLS